VKVHDDEGVAIHIGPGPCVHACESVREASNGSRRQTVQAAKGAKRSCRNELTRSREHGEENNADRRSQHGGTASNRPMTRLLLPIDWAVIGDGSAGHGYRAAQLRDVKG
jgi:hypothetical protein